MFKIGDYVWAIDRWSNKVECILIIGEIDSYYIGVDYFTNHGMNIKELAEEIYVSYTNCRLWSFTVIKKEEAFAAKEEAEEVLESEG